MLAAVPSATLLGVRGLPVRVEVHVGPGLPSFTVVGLPDASCRESRDRVRAAVLSAGLRWPNQRVTVNLSPGEVPKSGAGLDLPVAVGVLVADGQLDAAAVAGAAFLAELGLDGSLRPVVGAVPLVDAMSRDGAVPVVAPSDLGDARSVAPAARAVGDLRTLVELLRTGGSWPEVDVPPPPPVAGTAPDLAEVRGHRLARQALEVSAAGGHHLLLSGPPGAGKTMLAERLAGLLPDLDEATAAEVARVRSACGDRVPGEGASRRPPYRAPHHTASLVALVGGGTSQLRPGEISRASGGVLFLDELGEFSASHLDALRQPLESGRVRVARAGISVELPAAFLLVAATNPCPCGPRRTGGCRCSPAALLRYQRRMSGPVLDRFDLRLLVEPPGADEVLGSVLDGSVGPGEGTAAVRTRVEAARRLAAGRGVPCNRRLAGAALEAAAPLSSDARDLLRERLASGALTVRGAQRVRAVALTLADLAGRTGPLDLDVVATAAALRAEVPDAGGHP